MKTKISPQQKKVDEILESIRDLAEDESIGLLERIEAIEGIQGDCEYMIEELSE